MKEKVISVSIVLLLVISIFSMTGVRTASSSIELPDYEGVHLESGLAGDTPLPSIEDWVDIPDCGDPSGDTPAVGTTVYDWYLDSMTGGEAYTMTLRAVVGKAEVWVQDDLSFPEGDARNDNPVDWTVTDEMCEYIAEEFDSHIYPVDTTYFGEPLDRYGNDTIFEYLGWPEWTYDWIEVSDPVDPQRTIIKVLNYRDFGYYNPWYPYFVIGFFSSTYDSYYDRNMVHLDCWQWWRRLGLEGTQWYPDTYPELVVPANHQYDYVGTLAHEYQHLIHADYNPADPLFMNEGCSMYAEILCGYGVSWGHVNSYLYTPDNSLTEWGDQGDINILADYGAVTLWTVYLSDHYGGAAFLSHFVQAGIPGVEGIDAALEYFGYTERFDDVYRDWRIANLIHTDFPGCGKYNYVSIDLGGSEAIPIFTHEISGLPVPSTKGTDFGNTLTDLGYDVGISKLAPYGSDYIVFKDWKKFGKICFDGDETTVVPWEWVWNGTSWYSGALNLVDNLMVAEAYVDPMDPTLELTTYWDIEDYWDFGFVQVSTDGGETWVSLANEYTTDIYDPSAHPDIVANLPGLTSWSKFIDPDGWITMEFDLEAYAGETVMIGFRYMTDWGTVYEGWYISEASVSGEPLTLTPVIPEVGPADFMVTVVHAYVIGKCTIYVPVDMQLCDETHWGIAFGFTKPSYTILIVSSISEEGFVDYEFSANKLFGRFWNNIDKCK
jgi:immune inhibitor A